MKKKILSVLLALALTAGLFFALTQVSAEGTTYHIYVSADGSDATKAQFYDNEASPYLTVRKALLAADKGTYEPGDRIVVHVISETVYGDDTTNPGSSILFNAANSSFNTIADTAGNFVPVTVQGEGDSPEDTTLVFYGKANVTDGAYTSDSSQCRRFNTLDLTFKNLTLKTENADDNPGHRTMTFSASYGNLTFDSVLFDHSGFYAEEDAFDGSANTAGKAAEKDFDTLGENQNNWGWLIDAGCINAAPFNAGMQAFFGATAETPVDLTPTVTFRNGNYAYDPEKTVTGPYRVAAAAVLDSLTSAHVGPSTTYCASYNPTLVIGDQAKMDEVYGSYGINGYDNVTVLVDGEGAEVNSYLGTVDYYPAGTEGKVTPSYYATCTHLFILREGTVRSYRPVGDNFRVNGTLKTVIEGGTLLGDLAGSGSAVVNHVEMTISAGTFTNQAISGTGTGTVNGNVTFTLEGTARFDETISAINVIQCKTVNGVVNVTVKDGVYINKNLVINPDSLQSALKGGLNVTFGEEATEENPLPPESQWPRVKDFSIGKSVIGTASASANTSVTIHNGFFNTVTAGAYQHYGDLNLTINGGLIAGYINGTRNLSAAFIKGDHNITVHGGEFGRVVDGRDFAKSEYGVGTSYYGRFYGNFGTRLTASSGSSTPTGDIVVNIDGGTFLGEVAFACNATNSMCKNLTVTLGKAGKPGPSFLGVDSGKEFQANKTKVAGGQVTLNVYSGTFNLPVYATYSGTVANVESNIYGGTFQKAFHGAGTANISDSVEVNISGSPEFVGDFYAGGTGTITNDLILSVEGSPVFRGTAYTADSGDVSGTVSATITGGTFQNNFYVGGSGTASALNLVLGAPVTPANPLPDKSLWPTFESNLYLGNRGTVTGAVTSVLHYGNVATFFGSVGKTVGSVHTTVYNGDFEAFYNTRNYGGSYVNGNCTLIVSGGTFDLLTNVNGEHVTGAAVMEVKGDAVVNGPVYGVQRVTNASAASVSVTFGESGVAGGPTIGAYYTNYQGVVNGATTVTVYGGTFNGIFTGGASKFDYLGTSTTTNIYGGTFYARVYGGVRSATGTDYEALKQFEGITAISLNVEAKMPIVIHDAFAKETGNSSLKEYAPVWNLKAGASPISIGPNGTFLNPEIVGSGTVKIEILDNGAKSGKVFFAVAEEYRNRISWTKGNPELLCTEQVGSGNFFLMGPILITSGGFEFTDRISARIYFDSNLDYANANMISAAPYTMSYAGKTYTGTFGTLLGRLQFFGEQSYYYLPLPDVKISDYDQTGTFTGFGNENFSFNVLNLAKNAYTSKNYAEQYPQAAEVAKTVHNYIVAACIADDSHQCGRTTAEYLDAEAPEEVTGSSSFTPTGNNWTVLSRTSSSGRDGTLKGRINGRSLILGSTVAAKYNFEIRRSDKNIVLDLNDFQVKIGSEVVPKGYYTLEYTKNAVNGDYNGVLHLTLHITAKMMDRAYTVTLYHGEAVEENLLCTVNDSLPLMCQAYQNATSGVSAAQKELATRCLNYIQTVASLNSASNTASILQERRNTAYEAMLAMMTTPWIAKEDITYKPSDTYAELTIVAGRTYIGLPYSHGCGNLHSFMETETETVNGIPVLDLSQGFLAGSGTYARLSNDCADCVFWAWSTVSDSISFVGTTGMTDYYGCLKVGDYETTNTTTIQNGTHTNICEANGEQRMFRAYALMQRADAIVMITAGGAGHARMIDSVYVVYNEDGTINNSASYVITQEQTSKNLAAGTTYEHPELGTVYVATGWNTVWTFQELFDSGYIPVTCKEFIDPTPLADPVVTDSLGENRDETNLFTGELVCNRRPSSIHISISDMSTSQVVQSITAFGTQGEMYKINMARVLNDATLGEREDDFLAVVINTEMVDPSKLGPGTYECTATIQIATGEWIPAFQFEFTVE